MTLGQVADVRARCGDMNNKDNKDSASRLGKEVAEKTISVTCRTRHEIGKQLLPPGPCGVTDSKPGREVPPTAESVVPQSGGVCNPLNIKLEL